MLDIQIGGMRCKISLLFPAVLLFLLTWDHSGIGAFGFLAAALHECGHFTMLLIFGEKPSLLTLSFFGMRLCFRRESCLSWQKEVAVFAAGPLMNGICAVVLHIMGAEANFIHIHIILAAVNSLPILPLDGGQIVYAVLCALTDDQSKVQMAMNGIFWIIWSPLLVLGIAVLWYSRYNGTLLVLVFYLGFMRLFYKGN